MIREEEKTTKTQRAQRFFLLAPVVLVLCCFANTLGHGFVYDDRYQIVEAAPVLQNWNGDNLLRLFDRDIWAFFCQELSWEGKTRTAYYRPLFALFVMINYWFAGLNPVWWHLTAIVLHALASMLAYWLLYASLRAGDENVAEKEARLVSLLGAVLFAIHPAQSESVAWIAAYVNALSAIFIFGSLLAYLRSRRGLGVKLGWVVLSSGFYVLGLLTKEVAIVVPAVIVAYELFVVGRRQGWGERLRQAVVVMSPFVLLTLAYLALRVAIFGAVRPGSSSADFPEMREVTGIVNLLTLPTIVLKYIEILIRPFALSPMYAVRYLREAELWNFFVPALALVLISLAGLVAAFRSLLVRIGIIWLLVPLLPALDTRSFKPEDLVHDRYLYLSLLGAGFLFAGAVRWLSAQIGRWSSDREQSGERLLRPSVLLLVAAIILVMSATTIKQNVVWADEWNLWDAARETVPNSCVVNLELGRLSEEAGRNLEAVTYYEMARGVCPDSVTVYYKLGLFYGRMGNLARAEESFQRMATLAPYRMIGATAHFNLGIVYEKQGDLERAIDHYQKGLELNPASKNAEEVRRIIGELTAKLRPEGKG